MCTFGIAYREVQTRFLSPSDVEYKGLKNTEVPPKSNWSRHRRRALVLAAKPGFKTCCIHSGLGHRRRPIIIVTRLISRNKKCGWHKWGIITLRFNLYKIFSFNFHFLLSRSGNTFFEVRFLFREIIKSVMLSGNLKGN